MPLLKAIHIYKMEIFVLKIKFIINCKCVDVLIVAEIAYFLVFCNNIKPDCKGKYVNLVFLNKLHVKILSILKKFHLVSCQSGKIC